MFVSLGLFGVIPACHHLLVSGWHTALMEAAMHRVFIQAGLYILGECYKLTESVCQCTGFFLG